MAVVAVFALKMAMTAAVSVMLQPNTRTKREKAPEGPVAQNILVQTSGWGTAIPIVYGKTRLSGNVIWSSAVVGSAGAEHVSLALGLCRGPVTGISRVWVNGDIVYDEVTPLPASEPGSDLEALRAEFAFRFYNGDETQGVDPATTDAVPVTQRFEVSSVLQHSPPVGAESTHWIVAPPGSGAWAGHDNQHAQWLPAQASPPLPARWVFRLWAVGAEVNARDTNKWYRFNGTAWIEMGDWDPNALPGAGGPAYRGLCYIMFPDFSLHLTQGYIPQFEVELSNLVPSAPFEEIDQQTTADWIVPPEGEDEGRCVVLGMTNFVNGIYENQYVGYYGDCSLGSDGLTISPSGDSDDSYWHLRGDHNFTYVNLVGAVEVRINTRPTSQTVRIASCGLIQTSGYTALCLRPDGHVEVYAGTTLVAHSLNALTIGSWYRITWASAMEDGSHLWIDGVKQIDDSVNGYNIMGSMRLGDYYATNVGTPWSATFREAVFGEKHRVPHNWKVSTLPYTVASFSGWAVAASSGTPPYFSDGSTATADILALVRQTGGWPVGNAQPPAYGPPNTLGQEYGHVARAASSSSFDATVIAILTSLPNYVNSRFYAIQAVGMTRHASGTTGQFALTLQNLPEGGADVLDQGSTITYYQGEGSIADCHLVPKGFWTSDEVNDITVQVATTSSETHLAGLQINVLHATIGPTQTTVVVPPGTAVDTGWLPFTGHPAHEWFLGTLHAMTCFKAGLRETNTKTSTGLTIVPEGLEISPVSSAAANWALVAPASANPDWPCGNIIVRIDTPPTTADVAIAQIAASSNVFLVLRYTDLVLEVRKTTVTGTVMVHSAAPIVVGQFHRISFRRALYGGDILVDGVPGIRDIATEHSAVAGASLYLGGNAFQADYKATFRAAALTSDAFLPEASWAIDRVEVTGTLTNWAVIAHQAASPYYADGSTDQATMMALVNQTGGWLGNDPPTANSSTTESAGLALRCSNVGGGWFVGQIVPIATSLPSASTRRFYGIDMVLTDRYEVSNPAHTLSVELSYCPYGENASTGPSTAGANFRGHIHRVATGCGASSPGYWTAEEVNAIIMEFVSTTHDTQAFSLTVYLCHSDEIPPPVWLVNNANGANVVLSHDQKVVYFMEWGHWYVYGIVHGLVYAESVFLSDPDLATPELPTLPPLLCDFDVDENDMVFTTKVADDEVVYDSYSYTVLASGDSVETEWPLTIDTFVNGVTVQSTDFYIPVVSGNYLDLDLQVKVNNVLCGAGYYPYAWNADTRTIEFVSPPASGLQVKAAWGFVRTLTGKATVVRMDVTSSVFTEITTSGFMVWECWHPTRVRVGRTAAAPILIMAANNSDSDSGSTIKIRAKDDFRWTGIILETTIGPAAGSLFKAMTIDDVTDWVFAVSSDGNGAAELVIACLNRYDAAVAIRFDISAYLTDPEVIMVWDSTTSGGASDRIAIGQRGLSEKMSFWSFEIPSGGSLEITYLGELAGQVVPDNPTSAWRRGAHGADLPILTCAYSPGGASTKVISIDLASQSVQKIWYLSSNDSGAGLLPTFSGGSVYSEVYEGVFAGCIPVSLSDLYSYIWIALNMETLAPTSLAVVVADICRLAGLAPGQYEASSLTGPVLGYTIDNRMSARSALAPIADAYAFDGIETEGRIVFLRRTGIPVVSIPATDLAAHEEGSERPQDLTTTQVEEVSLPTMVEVGFIDYAADYAAGLARGMRSGGTSGEKTALSFPLSMAKEEARRLAWRILTVAWLERYRFRFFLCRMYAHLNPGDVVTVTTSQGLALNIRIESMTPSGGVIEVDGILDSRVSWE